MSAIPFAPISEYCEIVSGFAFKSENLVNQGIPVIKISNITDDFRVETSSTQQYFPEEMFAKKHEKYILKNRDIIIAMTGAKVGKIGRIRNKSEGFTLLNQRVAKISCDNINSDYLWAAIRNPGYNRMFSDLAIGAAQPNMSAKQIGSIKVPIFTKVEEKKIGQISNLFDSMVEINFDSQETCQQIVSTLFRSWFIDFDPVKAKAEGKLPYGMDEETAALFPYSFEDSELGPIPKGWEVISLGDIAKKTIGGIWGEDKPLPQLQAVRCLRGVDIGHLRNRVRASPPIRWVSNNQMQSRMLENTDILIAGSGAGPLGKTIHCHSNLSNLYTETVVYSNFVSRLRCPSNFEAFFVELTLHHMRQSKEIWSYATGSAIPNLDVHGLLKRRMIKPPQNVIEFFYNKMGYLDDLMNQNVRESNDLILIRDALLPRLMSGELSVS